MCWSNQVTEFSTMAFTAYIGGWLFYSSLYGHAHRAQAIRNIPTRWKIYGCFHPQHVGPHPQSSRAMNLIVLLLLNYVPRVVAHILPLFALASASDDQTILIQPDQSNDHVGIQTGDSSLSSWMIDCFNYLLTYISGVEVTDYSMAMVVLSW